MKLSDLKGRCRIEGTCWIWAGGTSDGWPRIWAPDFTNAAGEKRSQTGTRAAWHLKTGKPIPNGWWVFLTCDGGQLCVNPDHMQAMPTSERGAQVAASGELRGVVRRVLANRKTGRARSHLNPELLERILTSRKTGLQLAAETGLSRSVISKVRTGKAKAFQPVGGLFTGLIG